MYTLSDEGEGVLLLSDSAGAPVYTGINQTSTCRNKEGGKTNLARRRALVDAEKAEMHPIKSLRSPDQGLRGVEH